MSPSCSSSTRPEHFVVGGGFFVRSVVLPLFFAWDAFGEKNGADSMMEMRRRIERYRRRPVDPAGTCAIGCVLLSDPFFFDSADWIPAPPDFHPTIVQGKTYNLQSPVGQRLWQAVWERWQSRRVLRAREPQSPPFGDPVLVRPRLGQGTFRVLVTETYRRRCAISQEKVLPVLEAAHIRPVSAGGTHRIDNGLLLRTDLHALFDKGYVTVTPEGQVRVSRRLREDFDNGETYFRFQGREIWMPPEMAYRPNRAALAWHADEVFLG